MIGIDEAQFFDDLYEFCCEVAEQDGKTVVVAGLDGDYLRYTNFYSIFKRDFIHIHYSLVMNLWFMVIQEEFWIYA